MPVVELYKGERLEQTKLNALARYRHWYVWGHRICPIRTVVNFRAKYRHWNFHGYQVYVSNAKKALRDIRSIWDSSWMPFSHLKIWYSSLDYEEWGWKRVQILSWRSKVKVVVWRTRIGISWELGRWSSKLRLKDLNPYRACYNKLNPIKVTPKLVI